MLSTTMQGAAKILDMLTKADFEAYIIGGAVRDILMHQTPHDFDIVTSAKPEEVTELLLRQGYKTPGVVGKSFGVVIAELPEGNFEVATFRKERYGADSHKPEEIIYADSLEEDVLRRDFTVNGMAMNLAGDIIDLVEGQKDIKKKRLRTIGKAEERFQEDALRLFRACRFVGKLDFLPHKSLLEGMESAFYRVKGLSLERVRNELELLLITPAVAKGLDVLVQSGLGECSCRSHEKGIIREIPILPELTHLVTTPQQKEFHAYDAWYHTLAVVQASKVDLTIRWAALLHDVAKGLPEIRAVRNGKLTDYGHDAKGAEITLQILRRLGYGKPFCERVSWLVENHMHFHYFANTEEADAWKWVRREARSGKFRYSKDLVEAFEQQKEVCRADVVGCGRPNSSTAGTEAMGECLKDMAAHMPVHTKDLNYSKDLVAMTGKYTGEILKNLLGRVQNGQLENTSAELYKAAKHRLERKYLEKK